MKKLTAILLATITLNAYAADTKVYWRCADGHLEAIEHQIKRDNKTIDLYVNYSPQSATSLSSTKIDKTSRVDLPASVKHGDFIMLGEKGQWLMNCVGQLDNSPNYRHQKLVFDVSKNAFGCPLIPKGCAAKVPEGYLSDD